MRTVIFLLSVVACNFVVASDWNDRISFYLDVYSESVNNPKPIVYPQLSDRIKNTFLSNSSNYVKLENEINGIKALSAELYYTEGELVIVQHNEGWNLVSKGNYVFEWKYGETTGVKFDKNDKDLVDYILYITDPSYIMTSLYNGYITKPEMYEVREYADKPYKELVLKKPLHGFEAVLVNINSLWFHGFKLTHPITKDSITSYINKPQGFQSLPDDIKKEMARVTFKESELTVRRHMVYL